MTAGPLERRDSISTGHPILSFHRKERYKETTESAFTDRASLPILYTWNTESKLKRYAKAFFSALISLIILPIGIYHLFHFLVGKFGVLPASSSLITDYLAQQAGYKEYSADSVRSDFVRQTDFAEEGDDTWKYKRFAVEVDGIKIDAAIIGKANTLDNGKWVLASNANCEFYEGHLLNGSNVKQILSKIDGNAIVFNYPGVGASSGMPDREAMAKAYRAMLEFLEDKNKGIGATHIIGYGRSLGAGVQGDALNTHPLQEGIKYVFVKDRTFCDLATVADAVLSPPSGSLIRGLGWNMDLVESSKKLKAKEIILQTGEGNQWTGQLYYSEKISHDKMIPPEASLAKALLDEYDKALEQDAPAAVPLSRSQQGAKVFLAIGEIGHNDSLGDSALNDLYREIHK